MRRMKRSKRRGQGIDLIGEQQRTRRRLAEIAAESEARETDADEWSSTWAERRQRVDELRSLPYAEYLTTPEWRQRRARALRAASYRCQRCLASPKLLNVHHRTYERVGRELETDLVVLCRPCHKRAHHLD